MSEKEFRRPQIVLTKNLRTPNPYTLALDGEYRDFAFNEERAPEFCGQWRSQVFSCPSEAPIDLEIGTGNGKHFQHRALTESDRYIVGIELKYKPLIQSIRGVVKAGGKNARACRFHAMNVDQLFAENELNNIYIHFPDPWVAPRKPKNRTVNSRVLGLLYDRQRPGSFLDFKTDSREYFLWSLDEIAKTKYQIERQTLNLYQSEFLQENFPTQFEQIFVRQGIEINYLRLRKKL